MPLICAVHVAEGWSVSSIVAGAVLLAVAVGLVALAVRVTLRR
jgi:hypothetical protein